MIKDVITYLNAKIETLGFFNTVLCLCERIEREDKVYPAQYTSSGEYKRINLDSEGSLCYWRKNGDVSISEEENSGGVGVQYRTTAPLKFIGYIKKEPGKDDQYFSDNIISGIIGNLTINNSALKTALKAKMVRVSSTRYSTDSRLVGREEYDNIDFEVKYTHAYFSIDFELVFVTATQCYTDICGDLPINFGYVTIKDSDGNILEEVKCGSEYTCDSGGTATVENSNASYSDTVESGETLVIPDTTVNVYIDGELNQTVSLVTLDPSEQINISI